MFNARRGVVLSPQTPVAMNMGGGRGRRGRATAVRPFGVVAAAAGPITPRGGRRGRGARGGRGGRGTPGSRGRPASGGGRRFVIAS